ncbi:MAG: hypothetical protein HOW73_37535 [Polyangiaceae bacterium]|nr:hypothetical protein [Polyangiaceae bacterium]
MGKLRLVLAAGVLAACSSNVVAPDGDGGGGGNEVGGGGAGTGGALPTDPTGQPPPPPDDAGPADGSAPRFFAVTRIFTGGATLEGDPDQQAWRAFGYDIDHLDTAGDYELVCKPNGGVEPAYVHEDGEGGIDNAWGKRVRLLLAELEPGGDIDPVLNEPLDEGNYTLIFALDGLGPGANYSSMDAHYLEGRQRSGSSWLKAPESFAGTEPVIRFSNGYVNGHTWVSGTSNEPLTIKLSYRGLPFRLKVRRAVVTAQMSPDHQDVVHGIISGVADTEELAAEMRALFGKVTPDFCSAAADAEAIVRQASDIMNDGTQDPNAVCNGISVGLGFTATDVTIGTMGPAEQPVPPGCEGI